MPTIGLDIKTSGSEDFSRMARELRDLGPVGQKLMRAVRRRIAEVGKPVVEDVKNAARSIPVKGTLGGGRAQRRADAVERARSVKGAIRAARGNHALRARIANATSLRTNTRGVAIVVKASQMAPGQETLPHHLNSEKGWRHPVFGDRDIWVHQDGHPYFDVTIKKHQDEFRQACIDAISNTLDDIGR